MMPILDRRPTACGDEPAIQLPSRPRILVLRACRTPQFASAIARLRGLYPDAHLTALAPANVHPETRTAGADDVIAYAGRRFGLLHAPFHVVARLRRAQFDAVAVPQMTDDFASHANVYRFVLALGIRAVVLLPAGVATRSFRGTAFARFVAWESLLGAARGHDVPLMLALLTIAAVKGRWHRTWPSRGHATPARRRVLHIITSLGVGGAQLQLAELVDRTPADRYDVEILVLGRGDEEFSAQRFGRTDVTIDYLEAWPLLSASILEIAARCRRERYDIVHTWLFYANFVGAAGARLAGTPYVISGVRNLSLWKRAWNTKWWYRLADVLAARIPDTLTVNATPLVADHQWWARTRRDIPVVPNGLNPSRIVPAAVGARAWLRTELGLAADATVVGTVGRLAPEKAQSIFVRGVAAARATRPDLRAIIVGDGECGPSLKALAHELGVSDIITFMGRRADSRRIIAGLDVFVLTSASEGFPNVLLEAAFLGTPAISSDVAGSVDVLDSPNDVFPVGDVDAATACLLDRLSCPQTAQTRASVVRTRAYRLFTAETMTARWLALYNRAPNRARDGE
jgi:glycosyltransferase involved in cell wall biosynthesis